MNEEEAIKYLKSLDDGNCRLIADLIKSMRDEIDSTWQMLEEMRLSDISNHTETVNKEIDRFIKERRKIAKVSEA